MNSFPITNLGLDRLDGLDRLGLDGLFSFATTIIVWIVKLMKIMEGL